MDRLEIYVSGITSDIKDSDGWHKITCNTNCYGSTKFGTTIQLSPSQYESVMAYGYYME